MTLLQYLPDSNYTTYLFLENPWILAAVLILYAAVFGTLGWRYQRRGMAITAAVALMAAVAIVIAAKLIETGRETVCQRTTALIEAATSPYDPDVLADLLSEQVTMQVAGSPTFSQRDELLRQIQRVDSAYEFTDWKILLLRIGSQSSDRWRVKLSINTTLRGVGGSIFSGGQGQTFNTNWELDWAAGADGVWRLANVNWTGFSGSEPSKRLLP